MAQIILLRSSYYYLHLRFVARIRLKHWRRCVYSSLVVNRLMWPSEDAAGWRNFVRTHNESVSFARKRYPIGPFGRWEHKVQGILLDELEILLNELQLAQSTNGNIITYIFMKENDRYWSRVYIVNCVCVLFAFTSLWYLLRAKILKDYIFALVVFPLYWRSKDSS